MKLQEWQECTASTVTVGGVEKRVRDCTDDEIEIVRADILDRIRHAQAEIESLRELRKLLKEGFTVKTPDDDGCGQEVRR